MRLTRSFIGLFGLLLAAEAHAQQPDDQFTERHEQAVTHMKDGNFEQCAEIFVELYNEHENHDRADELLFNAAVCHEMAGAIGTAMQIRTALLERHPNSGLAEPTLASLAQSYAVVAHYEQAAERYEQYAVTYPDSKHTPDALQNAYLFRVGLGQTDAAVNDLDAYERLYERKDPQTAARIFWSRRSLLETSKQRREHALAYIQRYGKIGGLDRWLVAEAVVAQIDWRNSCAEPLLFDSCIAIERQGTRTRVRGISASDQAKVARALAEKSGKPSKPPTRCGGPGLSIIAVHARKRTLAADARARFGRILAVIGKSSIDIPEFEFERKSDFADAWAMAIVYQADADYEAYLRLELPTKLDRERLDVFFEQKEKLAGELAKRYTEVKVTGSPHWLFAATTRIGMMYESLADQLESAKIPRGQSESWCDPLTAMAEAVRERAIEAWEHCVTRSTDYQFFNEFSRLCEARLAELEPWRHPATNELFGEPSVTSTRMRTVGLLPE